jgi:hypothetical protein
MIVSSPDVKNVGRPLTIGIRAKLVLGSARHGHAAAQADGHHAAAEGNARRRQREEDAWAQVVQPQAVEESISSSSPRFAPP